MLGFAAISGVAVSGAPPAGNNASLDKPFPFGISASASVENRATVNSAFPFTLRATANQWKTLVTANRQVPQWGVGDVRQRATGTGGYYFDPVTGFQVSCVMDQYAHGANKDLFFEYSGGAAISSWPWVSGGRNYITFLLGRETGEGYLKDCDLATKEWSNERAAPTGVTTMRSTLSRKPSTPRILFYLGGANQNILRRYDTATNSDSALGLFPKDFSAYTTGSAHGWMHCSDDERWFIFQKGTGDYVIAWDSQTDTVYKKTLADWQAVIPAWTTTNEPHMRADGNGAYINGNNNHHVYWEFLTGTITDVTAVQDSPIHTDGIGSTFVTAYNSGGQQGVYRLDLPAATKTQLYDRVASTDGAISNSAHYLQPGVPDSERWLSLTCETDGEITNWDALTWTLHSGTIGVDAIFKTTPTYRYSQDSTRMGTGGVAFQYLWTDRNRFEATLTRMGSLGAIAAAGQTFHDSGTNTFYCRPLHELDLTGAYSTYIGLVCPNAICDGVGWLQLAVGGTVVLICHHYSTEGHSPYSYYGIPRGQNMQSGHGEMFSSDRGVHGGQALPFVAWVVGGDGTPTAQLNLEVPFALTASGTVGFGGASASLDKPFPFGITASASVENRASLNLPFPFGIVASGTALPTPTTVLRIRAVGSGPALRFAVAGRAPALRFTPRAGAPFLQLTVLS